MEVRRILFELMVLFTISMTTAHPRFPGCLSHCNSCQCPQETVYFSNLATPFPSIESIDYIPNCHKPKEYIKYHKPCCKCGCKCDCKDQLILPPETVELLCGLGYFPSASPLVTEYFAPALDFSTTEAYIPIASPCDSLKLATPVSPEIALLVKPIIL